MESSNTKTNLSWYTFPAVLLLVALFQLSYDISSRMEIQLIWLYFGLAFIAYFAILHRFNNPLHFKLNIGLAVLSRLLLLFSFPLLSDDIYRFIWDGSQLLHGINPFSYTPQELLQFNYSWVDSNLFEKMNSPAYYSVYPPINQLAFILCAIPGKGNLIASAVILRVFILVFELGNIYLIKKLLLYFKKDRNLVFLYALNPLVIVEFTGNLHFEAVMIFFTLLTVWLLLKDQWVWAAVALALAICSKLLPIIFLPLFIRQIGWKKSIYAGFICGLTTLLLFLPFLYNLELLQHFITSLQLYYGKFEFNGSIYQILKAIGWEWLGYNPIAYTSKILIALTLMAFMITYIRSKNMFQGIFWLMLSYFLFGVVIHPWYMLILVAFTPFLKWRFAIVWSLLICLSYYTYRMIPYQENMNLVLVEYLVIGIYFIYELGVSYFTQRRKGFSQRAQNFE